MKKIFNSNLWEDCKIVTRLIPCEDCMTVAENCCEVMRCEPLVFFMISLWLVSNVWQCPVESFCDHSLYHVRKDPLIGVFVHLCLLIGLCVRILTFVHSLICLPARSLVLIGNIKCHGCVWTGQFTSAIFWAVMFFLIIFCVTRLAVYSGIFLSVPSLL